jgi:hypothetical protein
MTYNRLLWLPAALRAAGLAVAEVSGWQDRGHADDGDFEPRAVMFHHDASPPGDSPGGLAWLVSGFRSSSDDNYDAQCWVDRYGTWYVVAAGRAQHAGAGGGWGAIPAEAGNRYSIGVETDHTTGEAWPLAQYASVQTGMAAICLHQGWDPATAVVGHKEYAPGRKDDPDPVDMDTFRHEVAAEMQHPMEDGMSAQDVQAVLDGVRAMLRLPPSGLAVPRGQVDNGNLAAMLVGDDQSEFNRDRALSAAVAALAAQLDPGKLADAVVAKLPAAGVPGPADVKQAIRETFAEAFPAVSV